MPATARSEPTERSMPAVMIVNVIPTAITPITETWSRMRSALSQVRNSGMRTEKNATSRASAREIPYSRKAAAPAGSDPRRSGCGARRASLATGPPPRQGPHPLLARLAPADLADQRTLPHHQHAVAHAEDLGQLGGDQQHGEPLPGQPVDGGVDLRLG